MNLTPRQRAYGRGRLVRKTRRGVEYGNIIAKYYVGGVEQQEATGTTDWKEATRFLNERMGDVGRGTAPVAGVYRITIDQLLDDLIAAQEVDRMPSLRTTRTHLVHLRPVFDTMRAAEL